MAPLLKITDRRVCEVQLTGVCRALNPNAHAVFISIIHFHSRLRPPPIQLAGVQGSDNNEYRETVLILDTFDLECRELDK